MKAPFLYLYDDKKTICMISVTEDLKDFCLCHKKYLRGRDRTECIAQSLIEIEDTLGITDFEKVFYVKEGEEFNLPGDANILFDLFDRSKIECQPRKVGDFIYSNLVSSPFYSCSFLGLKDKKTFVIPYDRTGQTTTKKTDINVLKSFKNKIIDNNIIVFGENKKRIQDFREKYPEYNFWLSDETDDYRHLGTFLRLLDDKGLKATENKYNFKNCGPRLEWQETTMKQFKRITKKKFIEHITSNKDKTYMFVPERISIGESKIDNFDLFSLKEKSKFHYIVEHEEMSSEKDNVIRVNKNRDFLYHQIIWINDGPIYAQKRDLGIYDLFEINWRELRALINVDIFMFRDDEIWIRER